MKNTFLTQEKCSRCGAPLTTRILSKMNEDVLCMDCADAEKAHPRYQEAADPNWSKSKGGTTITQDCLPESDIHFE